MLFLSSQLVAGVALRKESVDRNIWVDKTQSPARIVALRKESVDRNIGSVKLDGALLVALRKESVDRNIRRFSKCCFVIRSLSARRAWIEIIFPPVDTSSVRVSLSARRAWIEIVTLSALAPKENGRSPQGERG